MKDLIKQMLRENLSKRIDENRVNEINLKGAVAGGLMGLGAMAGGKAQAQDTPRAPQTEIPAYNPQEEDYIKGAINHGLYEPVGGMEYNKGLIQTQRIPFYDRKVTFTTLDDGTKVKVFLEKYAKTKEGYQKRRG